MKYVDLRSAVLQLISFFVSNVTVCIVDDSWVLFVLTPAWFPLARTHSSILVLTSVENNDSDHWQSRTLFVGR